MTVLRCVAILLLQPLVALASGEPSQHKLTEISRELVVSSSVQGDFRQEKYLSFVDTPFVSTGEFRLDRESGLFWHVLEPLESTMLVTEGRVFLDGKRVDDQGVGRLITTVMLGFMEGELSGLTATFDISVDSVGAGWAISLKPRSSRLRTAIMVIRIQGKQHLSIIEIVDAERNRTLIQFSNVRSDEEGTVPRVELPQ